LEDAKYLLELMRNNRQIYIAWSLFSLDKKIDEMRDLFFDDEPLKCQVQHVMKSVIMLINAFVSIIIEVIHEACEACATIKVIFEEVEAQKLQDC
jgi:hypothetical protein